MESVTPARTDSTKKLILFSIGSLPRLYLCRCKGAERFQGSVPSSQRYQWAWADSVKHFSIWPQGCSEIVLAKPSTTLCVIEAFTDLVFG